MVDAFVGLPDAVVVVDDGGTIVWANRSAERIFDRALRDWVGQSGLDLVHPDDQEFVLRSLVTIQNKEVGSPIEVRVKAAAGWRLIEMIGSTTRWLGNDVVLLCLRDLTERRRYELAAGREARFRSLVHNAGSIIMLVSAEGILESASSVMTRLLGHDPELLEGQPLSGIVARRDKSKFREALTAARRDATAERPVTVRVDLTRHGPGVVPFELHFVNLLDDPTVEGIVITGHDITAQVGAERDLSDALARLTATLDSTADGTLVTDTAGTITDFNRRFVEIWSLPDDAVARMDHATTLDFALDRLMQPEAFVARLQALDLSPRGRELRPARVQGRARHRVRSRGRSAWTTRSSAASTASAT